MSPRPIAEPAPATLKAQACECARLFRLGRDIEAGLEMSALWTEVGPLLNEQRPEATQRWRALLAQMLARQEAQDWLGLADYLEYEWVALVEEGAAA